MATIIKFILAAWFWLVFGLGLFAAETRHTPIDFVFGSSLTLETGVPAIFKGPVDFGSATVTGLEIGTGFQPIDPDLTALAALSGTNTIYYRSGTSAWSPVTFGSNITFSGGVLSTTGLQASDADLTAIAALTGTNTIYYRSGAGVWSAVTIGANMAFSGGVLSASTGSGGGATIDNTLNLLRGDNIGNGVDSGISPASVLTTANISDTAYDATTWDGDTTHAPSKNAVRDKIESIGATSISDTAFASSWDGVTTIGPSKNAVYDLIHAFDTDDNGKVNVIDMGAGIVKTDASGVVAPVTIGAGLAFDGTNLTASGITAIVATGDVTGTYSGGTIPLVIGAGKVTNAMFANVPTATFKGRSAAGTGAVTDMTVSNVKNLLSLTGTNSGDQTITLTGEVTGVGTGSFATILQPTAITNRTEDVAPDMAADFLLTWDASAPGLKKVHPATLASLFSIDTIRDPAHPTRGYTITTSGITTDDTLYAIDPGVGNSQTVQPSAATGIQAVTGLASNQLTYDTFTAREASVSLTGRTASVTTTNFVGSNPAAGLYRIVYYILATTAGTSGTLDVTLAWHDGTAARTDVNTAAVTFGTTAYATKTVIARADGAHQVTYAIAQNSPVGSPVYAFYSTLERLQ